MGNLVEMVADPEECAYDQKCKYGHRVESHAVYCHNMLWRDAPRKCRQTWYWGGTDNEVGNKDEDCVGFELNKPIE